MIRVGVQRKRELPPFPPRPSTGAKMDALLRQHIANLLYAVEVYRPLKWHRLAVVKDQCRGLDLPEPQTEEIDNECRRRLRKFDEQCYTKKD